MQRELVIFFRNPSTEHDERDPYESAMTSDRYTSYTQPVLQQKFVNESHFAKVLKEPAEWTAVVATSKRAGEAWANAVRCNEDAKPDSNWERIPLYTPGAGTTTTFSASDLPKSCFPSIVPGSEDTGCAENLGPFIVSHIDSEASRKDVATATKPFLVLTGDKNSSELTDHLQQHQVAYEELEVYHTSPLRDIADRLADLLEEIVVGWDRSVGRAITIWFAFFSPSSAEAVLYADTLATPAEQEYWYNQVTSDLEERYDVRIRFRMAAIGKTTGNYLRRQGFGDVVQAEKPNAEGMARAISEGWLGKIQL